jgi:hypothetical protein
MLIPPDILNEINDNGFPAHSIQVKVGCVVLLMRNIDVAGGLCNGTRLRIEKIGTRVLTCRILAGNHAGEHALIPRMNLLYNKQGIPFTRFQFPIKLCYAMTIHKSQGQTFDFVGVDFTGTIFTHGLVYVAMSRCSSIENLRLFLTSEQQSQYLLRNIVFRDLLEHAINPHLISLPAKSSSTPPSQLNPPLPEYLKVDPPSDEDKDDLDDPVALRYALVHSPSPPPPQPVLPSPPSSTISVSNTLQPTAEMPVLPLSSSGPLSPSTAFSSSLSSSVSSSSSSIGSNYVNELTYNWPAAQEQVLQSHGWYRGTTDGNIKRKQVLNLIIEKHMTINDAVLAVILG